MRATNWNKLRKEFAPMLAFDNILAYLDPMSGSLAVQCLVAIAASGAFFFRRVLFRPFAFLSRVFQRAK